MTESKKVLGILTTMMDICVTSVRLSLGGQKGARTIGYYSLLFLFNFLTQVFIHTREQTLTHTPKICPLCPGITSPFVCFLYSDSWVPQGLFHQWGAHWRGGGPACPLCKYHLTYCGTVIIPHHLLSGMRSIFNKDSVTMFCCLVSIWWMNNLLHTTIVKFHKSILKCWLWHFQKM